MECKKLTVGMYPELERSAETCLEEPEVSSKPWTPSNGFRPLDSFSLLSVETNELLLRFGSLKNEVRGLSSCDPLTARPNNDEREPTPEGKVKKAVRALSGTVRRVCPA